MGRKLDGPVSLRNAILRHQDAFIGTFTERLLAYAMGRVVDYPDMPMVRSIEREAAQNNNRFSSFVFDYCKSMPFQMRRARAGAEVSVVSRARGTSIAPGVANVVKRVRVKCRR